MQLKQVIKETKAEKKLYQCSLKVIFRGILKNMETQTKLFHLGQGIFRKLYTHSELVICILTFTFLRLNILRYAKNSHWVQNSVFRNGKFVFPNSFSLINT